MDHSLQSSRNSQLAPRNSKIGIAGTGALGGTVARALLKGLPGLSLHAISDLKPPLSINVPNLSFRELALECDTVVECLPAAAVPELAEEVLSQNKILILISSSALLLFPEIKDHLRPNGGRIIVPSGAIAGLDGVRALMQSGIKSARIATTKKPAGYTGAPYIVENNIDLTAIRERKKIFSGTAREAARGFPANINVAATLSLAGIGPDLTQVEIWADPAAAGNIHEIRVEGSTSVITSRVENTPDPSNPKSSILAANSIIALLRGLSEPLVVL